MAAASTVVVATYIGFQYLQTHTLVGAVIGVGLTKGVSHLNTKFYWKNCTFLVNYNSMELF